MYGEDDVDTVELPAVGPPAGPGWETIASRVQVDLGALSHQGKVRPNNEDHFYVTRCERSLQTLLTNLPPGQVPEQCVETVYGLLVADGMGGAAAGEVASQMAITTLVDLVLWTPDWIMRLDEKAVQDVVSRRMEQRFHQVQEAMVERARAEPNLSGMGTTMTLTVSLGIDLLITHVGDSRVYLFRQGRLLKLTHDHTLAQALVDAGVLRPEEAATHFLRHMLTRVIGTRGDAVRVELHWLRLADGDQLLLCTDGLTEMVPETAIAEVLQKGEPAAGACNALVNLALERGGRDNVTVVLARYHVPG
jgi:PPM family protein phosphatase